MCKVCHFSYNLFRPSTRLVVSLVRGKLSPVELKISAQARGTRILALNKASKYRSICDALAHIALANGAEELILPLIEPCSLYLPISNQLYTVKDNSPENKKAPVCVRPDGVATCSAIAQGVWRERQDVKVFYVTKCLRRPPPQLGHHREFTQFGYQILNPRSDHSDWIMSLARKMVACFTNEYTINVVSPRYPFDIEEFDVTVSYLGAEKQGQSGRLCSGGRYINGYGITLEVERIMLL